MGDQYSFPADKFILIGSVTKAHGLKGEIKVMVSPDQAEHFSNYSRVALAATDGRMTALLGIAKSRQQGNRFILKLDTIDTKNEADLTAGMAVLLPREDSQAAEGAQQSLYDLEGSLVKTVETGEIIGSVAAFFHNGAHNILVVRNKEEEFLIPLIDEIVVACNDGEILIDPPPGLLELSTDQDPGKKR